MGGREHMETMRMIRNVKKQIEAEYGIENAYELAEALVNNGVVELTDGIREKILYLQNVCQTVELNDYWVITLVAYHSLDEIKERYNFYMKYAGEEICKVDSLAMPCEKGQAYRDMLNELGFSKEQLNGIMKAVVRMGSIVKSEEEARRIVDDLAIFGLAVNIRNQFICENADFVFNDYSREARQVFEVLCQKYGKEKGFICLKEHPEYIRLGVSSIH